LLDLVEFALLAILPESSNPAQIELDRHGRQTSAAPVVNHGTFPIITGSRSHGVFDVTLMKSFEILSGEKYYRTATIQRLDDSLWITADSG
jgi:hypothetical protein